MDLATLTLQVNASGAVTEVRKLNAELDKTTRAAGASTQITKAQETQLRKLAESGVMYSDTLKRSYEVMLRQNGLWERYLQIQRQIDAEMRVATQVQNQHTVAVERTVVASSNATIGLNRFRSGLSALASQAAGVNPVIGQLSGLLASFAFGGAVTVGILGIATAYGKLSEKSRAAKKETDDLISSLVQQRKAFKEATEAGQRHIMMLARTEEAEARRDYKLLQAQRGGAFGPQVQAGALVFGGQEAAAKRLKDAKDAVLQSEENLWAVREANQQKAIDRDNEYNKDARDAAEQRKQWAAEDKKREDEALQRMKDRLALLLKIHALGDMGAVLANIDATLQRSPIRDSIDRINGPATTTDQQAYGARLEAKARDEIEWAKQNKERLLADKDASQWVTKLGTAAQVASRSLEFFLVSKLGGGGAGASLGAGIGSTLATGASAFGSKALGGAIFGPLGAAAGAIAGKLVGGLFGSSGEDRERQRQQKIALADLAATMDILRAKSQGLNTALVEQVEANRKYFESLKKQIDDALPGKKNERERNRQRAETDGLRAVEEQRIRDEYALTQRQARQDLEVRNLRAQGLAKEAEAMSQTLANERELAQARKDGADATQLALLAETQKLEAEKRAREAAKAAADEAAELAKRHREAAESYALATRTLRNSLGSRGLSALGNSRGAEDARFATQARQEMEDAIKAGMSPSTLAMLAFVQLLERNEIKLQREVEDQTKALAAQAKAFEEQAQTAREQLNIAQESLRVQERSAEETRRVFESLKQFSAGLKLNPSLTTLSPTAQLAEARSQYDSLLTRAYGGDKGSAGRLPDAARSFLEASRGVNASGMGYVSDFNRVQATLAGVTDQFGAQLTVEERILKELEAQSTSLEMQIRALESAKEEARGSAERQIAELSRQMVEQQQQYAESFRYYAEFLRTLEVQRVESERYFADSIFKLAGILENTFGIGTAVGNLRIDINNIKPNDIGLKLLPGIDQTNTELKAVVGLLQEGFKQQSDELAAVRLAITNNTSVTKQGLEAIALS